MSTRAVILGAAVAAMAAGCEGPTQGVVTSPPRLPPGTYASDITFTTPTGRLERLNAVRQPIAVVGFTAAPGDACCRLEPGLVAMSHRFAALPVSVVQVSQPTGRCPHGAGCFEVCRIGKTQVLALCDTQRIAWEAFGSPAPNTVFLIDQNSKVVATAPLEKSDALADQAEDLGRQERDRRKPVSDGVRIP